MLGFFIAFAVKCRWYRCMAGCRMRTHRLRRRFRGPRGDLAENRRLRSAAFSLPLFPNASAEFAPIAMWLVLSASSTVRGWPSPRPISNADRLHLGFPHGLRADCYLYRSQLAYQGAVIQMIAHGLSAAVCLFSAVSFMNVSIPATCAYGRSVEQDEMAASTVTVLCGATLGMPGTGNFVGEFMILFGASRLSR